jgi:hypothetical protein
VRQQLEAEEGRTQTLVKQVLITPRNYLRISARIVPQDQREAIRPGIIVTVGWAAVWDEHITSRFDRGGQTADVRGPGRDTHEGHESGERRDPQNLE